MYTYESKAHMGPRVSREDGLQMIEQALNERLVSCNDVEKAIYFLRGREEDNVRVLCYKDVRANIIGANDNVEELLARHQALSVATQTAKSLYAALNGDTKTIEDHDDSLARRGGFFEQYDEDLLRQRAADKNFLIIQLGGRFFNMNTLSMDQYKNVADIQVSLAADDPSAEPVAKLVEPKKPHDTTPEAQRVYREISQNRAIMACITDVGVDRGYGRYEVIPVLQNLAIRHIHETINPTRENPIRYIIAQFFRIYGLKVPAEKKRVAFKGYPNSSEYMHNENSFGKHLCMKANCGASRLLMNIPAEDVPVTFEHEGRNVDSLLEIGWSTVAIDMEKICNARFTNYTPNFRLLSGQGNHSNVSFLRSFDSTIQDARGTFKWKRANNIVSRGNHVNNES